MTAPDKSSQDVLKLVHDVTAIAEPARPEKRGRIGVAAEMIVVSVLSSALWGLWVVGLVRLWPGMRPM
jgi:hypothetical protein